MFVALLLIAVGVVLLYWGGEVLVSSSIHLASSFGISPLVIGLTVVAFATSSPELAATLAATLKDAPDIAVGNAFGSNVANLGLILGISVLLRPLTVRLGFLRREVAFMVVVTIVVYPLMLGGLLSRLEGLALLVLLVFFLWTLLRDPETPPELAAADVAEAWPLWRSSAGVALGIGLLVGGAHTLVEGATDAATILGVSERVVGFSLVALGTSLPELSACLVAARRNQADIVIGNVIGSNVFNLLCILGITSMVKPLAVSPQSMALDYWVMLGLTLVVSVMLAVGRDLKRAEGIFLLATYVGYLIFLYL